MGVLSMLLLLLLAVATTAVGAQQLGIPLSEEERHKSAKFIHDSQFKCDKCLRGFGLVGTVPWCQCCANNCQGFQNDCMRKDGFCVTTCLGAGWCRPLADFPKTLKQAARPALFEQRKLTPRLSDVTHRTLVMTAERASQLYATQVAAAPFAHDDEARREVVPSERFERLFPRVDYSLFTRSHARCAVVGNSGSVIGTHAGVSIDAADQVFRINFPEVSGFEEDVGSRTTVMYLPASRPFDTANELGAAYAVGDVPAHVAAQRNESRFTVFGAAAAGRPAFVFRVRRGVSSLARRADELYQAATPAIGGADDDGAANIFLLSPFVEEVARAMLHNSMKQAGMDTHHEVVAARKRKHVDELIDEEQQKVVEKVFGTSLLTSTPARRRHHRGGGGDTISRHIEHKVEQERRLLDQEAVRQAEEAADAAEAQAKVEAGGWRAADALAAAQVRDAAEGSQREPDGAVSAAASSKSYMVQPSLQLMALVSAMLSCETVDVHGFGGWSHGVANYWGTAGNHRFIGPVRPSPKFHVEAERRLLARMASNTAAGQAFDCTELYAPLRSFNCARVRVYAGVVFEEEATELSEEPLVPDGRVHSERVRALHTRFAALHDLYAQRKEEAKADQAKVLAIVEEFRERHRQLRLEAERLLVDTDFLQSEELEWTPWK